MKKIVSTVILIGFSCLSVADEQDIQGKEYSLSFSPLHFIYPMFRLTAEMKVDEKLGVALIGGSGRLEGEIVSGKLSVNELGAQLNYYYDDGFNRGGHFGVEVVDKVVDYSDPSSSSSARSSSIGVYYGHKYLGQSGFTFISQIGYQKYREIIISSSTLSGDSVYAGQDTSGVLLNLNMGYSF